MLVSGVCPGPVVAAVFLERSRLSLGLVLCLAPKWYVPCLRGLLVLGHFYRQHQPRRAFCTAHKRYITPNQSRELCRGSDRIHAREGNCSLGACERTAWQITYYSPPFV